MSAEKRLQSINFLHDLPKGPFDWLNFKYCVNSLIIISAILVLLTIVAGFLSFLEQGRLKSAKAILKTKSGQLDKAKKKKNARGGSYVTTLPISFKLSQVGFYPLLKDLASTPIKGAWLINFSYDYSQNRVQFQGYANSPKAVDDFVASVRKMPALKKKRFDLFTVKATQLVDSSRPIRLGRRASSQQKGLKEFNALYRAITNKARGRSEKVEQLPAPLDQIAPLKPLNDVFGTKQDGGVKTEMVILLKPIVVSNNTWSQALQNTANSAFGGRAACVGGHCLPRALASPKSTQLPYNPYPPN